MLKSRHNVLLGQEILKAQEARLEHPVTGYKRSEEYIYNKEKVMGSKVTYTFNCDGSSQTVEYVPRSVGSILWDGIKNLFAHFNR